jgi:hypothetical protein
MFCFNCGKILHGDKGCTEQRSPQQHALVGEHQWGVWLRADQGQRQPCGQYGGPSGQEEEADSRATPSEGRWQGWDQHREVPYYMERGGARKIGQSIYSAAFAR